MEELDEGKAAAADRSTKTILRWGLVGLVVHLIMCCMSPIPSFFLALVAVSKAGEHKRHYGTLQGKARLGQVLGWVTLALGLFSVVLILVLVLTELVGGGDPYVTV